MATDVKKHTTFAAGEVPKRQVSGGAGLADMVLSINDVVPCANATEQSQVASGLSPTSYPVGPTRPLTTVRGDARPLHQVEVSRDGSVFVPVSGVLSFGTVSARDTWTSSNSSLLSDGDRCVAGGDEFRWSGTLSAWIGNRLTTIRTNTVLTGTGALVTMTGLAAGTTSAGGVLAHTFPTAFPSACVGVVLMPDHQSGYSGTGYPVLVNGTITRTGFQSFWSGVGNAAVNLSYIAFGY